MALLRKTSTSANMAQTHLESAASLAEAMLGWKIPTIAILADVRAQLDRARGDAEPDLQQHDCAARLQHLHTVTARLASQELVLLTRLRQANHWSEQAANEFPLVRAPLALFTGAMGILDDAVRDLAQADRLHFDDPASTHTFLFSRGLLRDQAVALDEINDLEPMADYEFWGLLPLGDLAMTTRGAADALHRLGAQSDEVPAREGVSARYSAFSLASAGGPATDDDLHARTETPLQTGGSA
ncbi:MAG: hypothetical protein AAFO79_03375 [Pseudomonadota bacterium]